MIKTQYHNNMTNLNILDKLLEHICAHFSVNDYAKQTGIMVDVKYVVSIREAVDNWHCAV